MQRPRPPGQAGQARHGPAWLRPLRARPILLLSLLGGGVVAWLAPSGWHAVSRGLLGWNGGLWLYLLLTWFWMARADQHRLQRVAVAHAEGAGTVLAVVVVAALVSIAAIVVELNAAKSVSGEQGWPHVVFAMSTVAGAWLLLPTLFTMDYASHYYHHGRHAQGGSGLKFPDPEPGFHPDYLDFAYFSFTIAVASQTSDVCVTARGIRRLVLLQSVLSFVFNAVILAVTINIAAQLF